jgi:hypothetical protein
VTKKPSQKKVSPVKPQPVKREDQIIKSDKGGSKDKNWKPPVKKGKNNLQNYPSNAKI